MTARRLSAIFLRAFAVFSLLLGVAYGVVKLLHVRAELIYIAPAFALIYLGVSLFIATRKSATSEQADPAKGSTP